MDVILRAHGRQVEIGSFDDEDHISSMIANTGDFYERALLDDCFTRAPEGLIVDVGAHIGNHTLWFASVMDRQVVAFEPHGPSFRQLAANVARNDLWKRVAFYHAAVGSVAGRCRVEDPTMPNNSGSRPVSFGDGDVEVVALDDMSVHVPVAVVKVDVEGSALQVLEGARQTLERHRPLLYVETGEQHEQVEAMLCELGYVNRGWLGATPTHIYEAA